jgi:hypothetical protein
MQVTAKEQVATLKKSLDTSAQMIARLEADLEARTAAIEATVAAASGLKPTPSAAALSAAGSGTATPLDLAALLGVQDVPGDAKEKARKQGATPPPGVTAANSQINVQMINILQSQRDQYKEKLTRVSTSDFAPSLLQFVMLNLKPSYLVLTATILVIISQAETLQQKLQSDLESAQLAKQRLEQDNLALYSKIKYLQSYGSSGGAGAGMPYKSPQVTTHCTACTS